MGQGPKIFVACHKPFFSCSNEIFTPIQVGASLSKDRLDMVRDDSGENISYKNPYYCELTALYWVLKNVECDYVGLCHYRRYFMFSEEWYVTMLYRMLSSEKEYPAFFRKKILKLYVHCTKIFCTSKKFYQKTKINEVPDINSIVQSHDIILPHQEYLGETIAEQYCTNHRKEDWDIFIACIENNFSNYSKYIDKVFYENKTFYPYNMFVMRYDVFKNYCEWMFNVLFELEKIISPGENAYQKRVFGFLSERLLNLYIESVRGKYKIKEMATLFIK